MRAFELAVARRHQAVHESYQDAFSVSCASSALCCVSEAESEPDLLVSYRTLAARRAACKFALLRVIDPQTPKIQRFDSVRPLRERFGTMPGVY